jgi:phage repressor protein C with HTH and peptisase S24 domain
MGMSQTELATKAGLTQPTISTLEKGGSNTSGSLAQIASALGVSALWLETGMGARESGAEVVVDEQAAATVNIPLLEVKGSCGNGRMAFDLPDHAPVPVSVRLLKRFDVKATDLVGLYADGDSMSPFISHGDIMFFNKSITDLQDSRVYLLDTPDGLRVKRITRRVDGRVILRSDNIDKGRYPDEEYSSESAEHLEVKAQFCFRIG